MHHPLLTPRFYFTCILGLGGMMTGFASAQAAIETSAQYVYMADSETGTVLMDKQSQDAMNPSSMSKLMTVYVLFDELKKGSITLDTTFMVSEKAWQMAGSKMFVHVGDQVRVEDLLRGIVVQSGNDACVVVAEGIAGSEEAFAQRMNKTAKQLGLSASHFVNSTGWPDPNHLMSARDIGVLSNAIIRDFPDYYHYFSEASYTYAGITQPNRNRLLGATLGVDGLKTGHTEVAGFGIALSAKDADTGRRVVLVVNGLQSDSERISEGAKLLGYGLKAFENKTIIQANQPLEALPVWFGEHESVSVAAREDIVKTVQKGADLPYTLTVKATTPVPAPIKAGDEVGVLVVGLGEGQAQEIPLVATQSVEKATGLMWMKQFFYQYLLGRD